MRCLCRIHKSNEVLHIRANPYIFKNFGYGKTQKTEEQKFQNEIKKTEKNLQQAKAEAKLMVENARGEADSIIKKAEQNANLMMNKAIMDGYQKGYASAKSEIESLISEVRRTTSSFIEETREKTDTIFSELQDSAIEISLEIARKILDVELDRNDNALVSVVKNAVDKIKNETEANVFLHEEDLKKIEKTKAFEVLKEQYQEKLQFDSDSSIKTGDVLVQTGDGIIDAGINSQFLNIKNAVLQKA
jgi:flagellar assembly protein FliH